MVHELDVSLAGVGEKPIDVSLTATGQGRDNAGAMAVDGLVTFSWISSSGATEPGDSFSMTGSDGTRLGLVVRVKGDIRFRPNVNVEIADAY